MMSSRVDSFLDRSLVFARDTQRYLLARDAMSVGLHAETAASLDSYANGLNAALSHSTYIACDDLTLADIAAACELCLLTNEDRYDDWLGQNELNRLLPTISQYERLGAHLELLASQQAFSRDLKPYFDKLLSIWS